MASERDTWIEAIRHTGGHGCLVKLNQDADFGVWIALREEGGVSFHLLRSCGSNHNHLGFEVAQEKCFHELERFCRIISSSEADNVLAIQHHEALERDALLPLDKCS